MWKPLIFVLIAFFAVSAFSADLDTIQASIDKIYRVNQMMYMTFAMMLGVFFMWTMRLR